MSKITPDNFRLSLDKLQIVKEKKKIDRLQRQIDYVCSCYTSNSYVRQKPLKPFEKREWRYLRCIFHVILGLEYFKRRRKLTTDVFYKVMTVIDKLKKNSLISQPYTIGSQYC